MRHDDGIPAGPGSVRWWEAVVTEYGPRIERFARSRGISDAEDVAQDVLTAAAEHADNLYRDRAAFESWLFTVAFRRVAAIHRRRYRRPTEPLVAGDRPSHPASDPAVAVCSIETLRELDDGLARLTERERAVVEMRLYVGVDAATVGEALGMSPSHVRVVQTRALAKMRSWLPHPALEELRGLLGVPAVLLAMARPIGAQGALARQGAAPPKGDLVSAGHRMTTGVLTAFATVASIALTMPVHEVDPASASSTEANRFAGFLASADFYVSVANAPDAPAVSSPASVAVRPDAAPAAPPPTAPEAAAPPDTGPPPSAPGSSPPENAAGGEPTAPPAAPPDDPAGGEPAPPATPPEERAGGEPGVPPTAPPEEPVSDEPAADEPRQAPEESAPDATIILPEPLPALPIIDAGLEPLVPGDADNNLVVALDVELGSSSEASVGITFGVGDMEVEAAAEVAGVEVDVDARVDQVDAGVRSLVGSVAPALGGLVGGLWR
jgi:RNA polymerase sigma-70 factor (ECF subfamily)